MWNEVYEYIPCSTKLKGGYIGGFFCFVLFFGLKVWAMFYLSASLHSSLCHTGQCYKDAWQHSWNDCAVTNLLQGPADTSVTGTEDQQQVLDGVFPNQCSLFCYFPSFTELSEHCSSIEYHIHIWQISPQHQLWRHLSNMNVFQRM